MNTRKLTLTALLTAIALCIFTAEAQLPSLTAIPGIVAQLVLIPLILVALKIAKMMD